MAAVAGVGETKRVRHRLAAVHGPDADAAGLPGPRLPAGRGLRVLRERDRPVVVHAARRPFRGGAAHTVPGRAGRRCRTGLARRRAVALRLLRGPAAAATVRFHADQPDVPTLQNGGTRGLAAILAGRTGGRDAPVPFRARALRQTRVTAVVSATAAVATAVVVPATVATVVSVSVYPTTARCRDAGALSVRVGASKILRARPQRAVRRLLRGARPTRAQPAGAAFFEHTQRVDCDSTC